MRKSKISREAGNASKCEGDNDGAETSKSAEDSALEAGGATSSNAMATLSNNDSESEDSDVNRLQALLEARGLPPHFLGNLGPRMQQILHRSMGSGMNSKAQQYLQGLQAVGDESRQLQAAIGMCQLLVMGNEDTLAGFPIKSVVPALINLLKMEHNFDLMNHACRGLTYMMEALPRSSAVVVDAIPVLLEKLQVIQCMDVAEQSLTALDMLSHRHAPAILAAGGQSACLLYIDFFSLPAQRSALSVAANCSSAIGTLSPDNPSPKEEFQRLVKSCLPLLSSRLTHHDKKCVESVCLCFVRLIDNYQYEPDILSEIAENDLLKNLQQLLVISPPVLSSNTFVMVIRSMTVLCRNVRSLVVELIRGNIAETLSYLLCGTPSEGRNGIVELLSRSSQELFEITTLITHLLPKLPMDDPLFAINSLTCKDNSDFSGNTQLNGVSWQWKDGTGQWQSYTKHAIRMLESAYAAGEHEVNLNTLDSSYTIDFEIMQQINDDTGTSRFVQRVPVRVAYNSSHGSLASQNSKKSDMEWNDIERDMSEFGRFVKTIFVIIYEVYCSSAGSPAVRQSCLHAMQKMVFFSKPELLIEVLRDLTLSSQISSMLSSFDIKLIVSALQLSEMIMQKLPDIFRDMFCKEGVVHQVKQLTDPSHPLVGTATDISKTSGAISNSKDGACGVNLATKKSPNSMSGKKSSTSSDDVSPPLTKAKAFAAAMSGKDNGASGGGGAKKKSSTRSSRSSRSSTSSFLSNFNPSKWGKSLSSALGHDSSESSASKSSGKTSFSSKMAQNSSSGSEAGSSNKSDADMKQVRQWIVNQAKKFLEYFKTRDDSNPQTNVLDQLTDIAKNLSDPAKDVLESLKQLCDISSLEVSPFELQHSGIVTSLLRFFTVPSSVNETPNCDYDELHIRIRKFLSVFAGLPEESMLPIGRTISHIDDTQTEPLLNMVRKLNQCVGQMEQFPVKSRDLMSGSSQILHVLSTKQLKCQLQRHPASRSIKQWLGGPVKVDPLVQVHAIERYLVTRGYGVKSSNISLGEPAKHMHLSQVDDQEDDSDDDMQNTVNDFDLDAHSEDFMSTPPESRLSSAASNSASSSMDDFGDIASGRARKPPDVMHKLAFYIGDHKVPHHITVYQALQQYGQASSNGLSGDERDRGFRALEKASFWNKTHIIMYRLASENDENSNSSHKEKTSIKKQRGSKQGRSTGTKSKVNDPVWSNGIVMPPRNPLHQYLTKELPLEFSTSDPCKEVLCLLRIIHAIVRFWYYLYSPYVVHTDKALVQPSDFVNFKVNAKCQHQLQDPLVVITGQLSTWVQEIGNVCPFLLAFEVRQLLFKVSALGRDRALQHLLETGAAQEFSTALNMSSHSSDNSNRLSRFMPRIEKKKCSVSRKNLLQQAEKIISDHGHSRAMIEVDYEEEVGTGLGPTLEFFTLTSKELQGCSLGLWRDELPAGEALSDDDDVSDPSKDTSIKKYVATNVGLFPKPLGRAAKHNQVSRIKSKYRFIGKFLAKALLDGRLVDLPLSTTCYKWLLGKEHCFTSLDLMYVDTSLASSHGQFRVVAQEREHCFSDHEKLEQLSMDGCPIEDIGLDMRLPGYPNVELLKMGKNTSVTPHNFDKYLDLITHWTLHEGVKHQMDALREGFNSVLPISCLNYFYPEELDQLFCGCRYQPWDVNELSEACHPDHGYTQNSVTVKSLYKILSSYTASEQQNFLQFVTGCPHLPVGGLRVLNPRLTIVRKTCEDAKNIDDYLPSVMTCLNYLKLPEYSSEEVMRKKLKTAIKEGQKSFLLS
uniref:E3 ubiquitin-protein ligase TRIP12-like n=1 Tax=Styela clava TaxID=7725 RepID=UPI00193A95DE|nr:E3 ubiquitin-protein ligase TRIP12-like [Styela clava]